MSSYKKAFACGKAVSLILQNVACLLQSLSFELTKALRLLPFIHHPSRRLSYTGLSAWRTCLPEADKPMARHPDRIPDNKELGQNPSFCAADNVTQLLGECPLRFLSQKSA
jgi:hypothetical protein